VELYLHSHMGLHGVVLNHKDNLLFYCEMIRYENLSVHCLRTDLFDPITRECI
jgi:hypothetical protein